MKVIIKRNKTRLLLIIIFLLFVLLISVVFILNPEKYLSTLFRKGILIFLVGIIGAFFSLGCMLLFIRKLISKNSKFVIDENGIFDNVNILNYPLINWDDIGEIEECSINNILHLKIFLKKTDIYIYKKKGLSKLIFNFYYKKYNTPILLNSIFLECSFDNFKDLIMQNYKQISQNK